MTFQTGKIAFQGAPGAYSDLACRHVFPDLETLPCTSFAHAFEAVEKGAADLAMIPIDNLLAGRVAAVHQLLPESSLHVVGEYFLPIHHCLMGIQGSKLTDLLEVRSHVHALPQCQKVIKELGLKEVVSADTAKAAEEVSSLNDVSIGAIGSSLAAKIYDLCILKENVEDAAYNTTRFLVMAPVPDVPETDGTPIKTSLLFRVRNIPAALYKAMGGFATNGVNMTKLESYMVGDQFDATQFYCDIDGHIDDPNVKLAIEELEFFAKEVRILGVYKTLNR